MTKCMSCFLVLVCSNYLTNCSRYLSDICDTFLTQCWWMDFVCGAHRNKQKTFLKVFNEINRKIWSLTRATWHGWCCQKHIFSKLSVEPLRPPTNNNLNTLHSQTEQLVMWAVFPCPAQPPATLSCCRCPGLSVNSCESLYFFHQAVL